MEPAQALAGLCCFGIWALMATPVALGAHWRMRAVERADGTRAVPGRDTELLWYAGASSVWPVALLLGVLGLAVRRWARVGRDAMLVFLGHITVVIVAVVVMLPFQPPGQQTPTSIFVLAASVVAVSAIATTVFSWMYASARVRRIEATPASKPSPGPERFVIYVVSTLMWPVGVVAAFVYSEPHNVRVGMNALRCSIVNMLLIALAVCIALPIFVSSLDPSFLR